jgi:hypothetical protein
MGKTYRRDQSFKPKGGKDFKKFKKSNKFKKWDEKPHKHLTDFEEKYLDSEE